MLVSLPGGAETLCIECVVCVGILTKVGYENPLSTNACVVCDGIGATVVSSSRSVEEGATGGVEAPQVDEAELEDSCTSSAEKSGASNACGVGDGTGQFSRNGQRCAGIAVPFVFCMSVTCFVCL